MSGTPIRPRQREPLRAVVLDGLAAGSVEDSRRRFRLRQRDKERGVGLRADIEGREGTPRGCVSVVSRVVGSIAETRGVLRRLSSPVPS
jgi:hypothetical protein